MDLALYYQFINGDTDANNAIREMINNPEYIYELFSLFEDSRVINDLKFLNGLCVILVSMVSNVWRLKENSSSELIEHSYSQNVISRCFDLCFKIDISLRQHFVECIRVFIIRAYNSSFDPLPFLFHSLMEMLGSPIDQKDTITTLEILSIIINEYRDEKGKDSLMNLNDIALLLEGILKGHIASGFMEPSYISAVTKTFLAVLKKGNHQIPTDNLSYLISSLLSSSLTEHSGENVDIMRESIFELIRFVIASFMSDKNRLTTYSEFYQVLTGHYIKVIEECIMDLFPIYLENRTQKSDSVLSLLLKCVYVLLKNNASTTFLNANFVKSCLIPAASLTNEMILDYYQNPEQYIGFVMNLESSTDHDSVRKSCYYYISIYRSLKNPPFDMISVLFGTDPVHELDFEARVFLCYEMFRGLTSKKAPKELSSQLYSFLLSSCDIENVIEYNPELYYDEIQVNFDKVLLDTAKVYLVPTLLVFLQYSNYSSSEIRDLSAHILINGHPNNPVLRISAATLLCIALNRSNDLGSIDPKMLLESVLSLLSCNVKDTRIGFLLQYLTNSFDCFNEYGLSIVQGLLESWLIENEQEDSDLKNESQDEMINSIVSILDSQQSSELPRFLDYCIEFASIALTNWPECSSIRDIIAMISVFSLRMDKPSPKLLILVPVLTNFLLSDPIYTYIINDTVQFFVPLIIKQKEFCQNDECLNQVLSLCDSMISNYDTSLHEPTCLASAIIIITSILLSDTQYIYLIDRPISILSNEEPVDSFVFLSCIYSLTSALFVTKGEISSSIPRDILVKWIESTCKDNAPLLRDMKTWILGLIFIAETGFSEAALAINSLLHDFSDSLSKDMKKQAREAQRKAFENCNFEEEEDAMFEEEEDFDIEFGEPLFSPKVILPIDEANVLKMLIVFFSRPENSALIDQENFESLNSLIQ